MAAGQIGGQALKLGLIDQVVVNLVPVGLRLRPPVLRDRRRWPSRCGSRTRAVIVQGDRVTHLVYDVRR